MKSLSQRVRERIAAEFPSEQQSHAEQILGGYSERETDRVHWDILALSRGDLKKLAHFTHEALLDYRDILYWAEYYHHDPVASGVDYASRH